MEKLNKTEYVSMDILEDKFVKIFIAIYRIQYLLGSGRVEIKSRFVTPPTLLQKSYTLFHIFFIFISIYFVMTEFFEVISDTAVRILGLLLMVTTLVKSLSNVIHTRFLNGHQNVDFHVKLQKLDRLLNIEKDDSIDSVLILVNAVSVLLILIVFILNSVIVAFQQQSMITHVGLSCFSLTFILELLACSSIVAFCLVRLKFVNFVIESYLNQEENVRHPMALERDSYIKILRFHITDINFAKCEVHNFLKELFSCFNTFQELYKFQFLLFSISYFVISLLSFEMVLYSTSQKELLTVDQIIINIGPVIIVIIDTFIAVSLAFRFELFFMEVKKTERLCIRVMALHQEGPIWEKARAMLKMIEETPPKFSVYDMWNMNASMFITMFGLVTNLIVTLLQFALL